MKTANSTMIDAMRKADSALLEDLRKLDEATHREGKTALSARLKHVATTLAAHFRLEEKNGYMDIVRKSQPRLEREIRHLEDEHRDLSKGISELLGTATAAGVADNSFQEKVRSWIEQMRRHEVKENSLVEEAFNFDVAAED